MATKTPKIEIHNATTNSVIEREMDDAEFAQYEIDQTAYNARKAEVKTKAIAKAEILDRIGLTADELQTILG